jgi:hypothetical protein
MLNTIFILLALFSILGLMFWFSHSQASKTRRSAAQFNRHSELVRRLQSLADNMPEYYLSKQVRQLILKEIISHLEAQAQIQPLNPNLKKHLQIRQEQLQKSSKQTEKPHIGSGPKDIREANEIRRRIHHITKFIERAAVFKRIDRSEAAREIQMLGFLSMETAVEIHRKIAANSLKKKKIKAAIYYLSRALREYQRGNQSALYQNKIDALKTEIDNLRQTQRSINTPKIAPKKSSPFDKQSNEMH